MSAFATASVEVPANVDTAEKFRSVGLDTVVFTRLAQLPVSRFACRRTHRRLEEIIQILVYGLSLVLRSICFEEER